MKLSFHSRSERGTTLVELSVTIAVILILAGAASLAIKPYLAYRDGRAAGEMLRAVKAAQLMYLADHPATDINDKNAVKQTDLLPYMPQGQWPKLPPVNGQTPDINFNRFPPVAIFNDGSICDPSGPTNDGLWDVGQY